MAALLASRAFAIFFIVTILIAITLLLAPKAGAVNDLYWDANGTSANTGTTAAGTWGTDAFWNTSSTGTGGTLTATTGNTNDLHFSSGTNYTGTFTVTTPNGGSVAANSIAVEEGNLTIDKSSGGGSTLSIAGGGITINSGAALTISGSKLTVALTAAQSWINNSSNLFSVTVPVTNGANLLTIGGTGDTTISGVIGNGTGGLTKSGNGTLTLSGANTYTGVTSVLAGTLIAETNAPSGSAGALGNASSAVLVGNTSGSSNAALLTGGAFSIGRTITVQSGNTGVITLGGNTADASIFSGAINLGTASGTAKGATLVALSGGSVDFQGIISENTSVPASNITIGDATHSGTVKLSNVANTYSGTTTITNGATLEVTKLATGGTNSSIGNSGSNAAAGSAASDLVIDGATLKYTGTGDSTNRLFTFTANGATIDASASANGALSFTGTGSLVASGTGNRTLTLTGASTGANSLASIIANPSSGTTSLTKSGAGTWTLTGASTYTGATTVNGGTLSIDNNNTTSTRLANTSSITVNSGGTFLLAQSGATASTNRINNSATMTLNGGTFNTGGLSEHGSQDNTAGMGALTLQSSSIIDMGSATSAVAFANSSSTIWSGTLNIYNWSGNPGPAGGGGTDELFFGNNNTGLTATQLAEVQFFSGAGTGSYGMGALILANGEIVPIPEPGTWAAGGLALGGLICWQRRRFMRFFKRGP